MDGENNDNGVLYLEDSKFNSGIVVIFTFCVLNIYKNICFECYINKCHTSQTYKTWMMKKVVLRDLASIFMLEEKMFIMQ